jgi:hypothetical protein
MKRRPRRGLALALGSAGLAIAALSLLALPAWGAKPKAAPKNSCVDCHADPNFLVQNKKLYEYYRNWRSSVHGQEGVTCVDCHGGDPKAAGKEGAHGGQAMSAANPVSPISYQNVPKTCANCHKDIYEGYQQSEHFKHLRDNPDEKQGPNCVTCHGSVSVAVLNVGTVKQACERCHNKETGNYPEIPEQAEDILSRFLSINRFYRYIATQGDPQRVKAIFKTLDPRIKQLNAHWHTFDLDNVAKETREVIDLLKGEREKISKQRERRNSPQ